jgi:NADPH-dependent 2,4-dienoyl-CoA reductase/sulfur reductase-like enzyme
MSIRRCYAAAKGIVPVLRRCHGTSAGLAPDSSWGVRHRIVYGEIDPAGACATIRVRGRNSSPAPVAVRAVGQRRPIRSRGSTDPRGRVEMSTPDSVVIVGAGLAGAKTAEALRDKGFRAAVTLVGEESELPYERPPLSKGYLCGQSPFTDAVVHPREWYAENDVVLRLGTRVERIDAGAHTVRLSDGDLLPYGALVLATGAAPRRLPVAGADAPGVHYLRTHADSDAIRAVFGEGRRLVVVGAGWIGLEVAAAARGAGTAVTVVEMAELPLLGVLGPELAQVFADLHREHGVDLRLGASLVEILVEGGVASGVRLADGSEIPADAVVVGVGVAPQVSLAETAGLAVDNGVLVDASLRASDPDVYAVGDIANHDHPVLGTRIRVEHWATALNQPTTAAAAILGEQTAYTELPYFFSDQYDLGMEYIGHAPRGSYVQVVIRGDLAAREFVAFWLDAGDRIVAAMNVNVWDVVDEVKPLILARTVVDRTRLADASVAYADVASG